ncbi:hypothetical protein KR018_001606 [Drosophila ironensis]|nr:hypothetical protein KR018_001606 [Drosophila ironensis]
MENRVDPAAVAEIVEFLELLSQMAASRSGSARQEVPPITLKIFYDHAEMARVLRPFVPMGGPSAQPEPGPPFIFVEYLKQAKVYDQAVAAGIFPRPDARPT